MSIPEEPRNMPGEPLSQESTSGEKTLMRIAFTEEGARAWEAFKRQKPSRGDMLDVLLTHTERFIQEHRSQKQPHDEEATTWIAFTKQGARAWEAFKQLNLGEWEIHKALVLSSQHLIDEQMPELQESGREEDSPGKNELEPEEDVDDEGEPELDEDFDDEEELEAGTERKDADRDTLTPEAIVAFLRKSKEIYERWCRQVERDPRKDYFTDKEWRDYYTVWCQEMGKMPSEQEYDNPYPYDLMAGTKHANRAARENYHEWLQQADGHVVENTIWVKADPRYPGIDPYTIWRIETGHLLPLEAYEKWKLDTGKDSFREFLRETYLEEENLLIASFRAHLNEQREPEELASDPLNAPLSDLVEPEDIERSGINEPEAEPPVSADQLNREASYDRGPEH